MVRARGRGRKTIPLERGKEFPYQEYTVTFVSTLDNSEFKVKSDETFAMKDQRFKLISVDTGKGTVVIEALFDNKRFEIGKMLPSIEGSHQAGQTRR